MTQHEQKTLFTALAFLSVAMKGKSSGEVPMTDQVLQLASLIEAFVEQHVGTSSDSAAMPSEAAGRMALPPLS